LFEFVETELKYCLQLMGTSKYQQLTADTKCSANIQHKLNDFTLPSTHIQLDQWTDTDSVIGASFLVLYCL